ncbi:unnamed protein product [Dibothriocephalus latus]|uniref:Uncharacterized protein n=1 Tax=Dibothriocephalus latus TaxID=60516 RepID=A0A3P6UQ47_DIBLA|nr:unnamed protein product [Dibothriocephalus latus]
MAEHNRAVNRMDRLSLAVEHCADAGHKFAFQNAEIMCRRNDHVVRETIEAWHRGTTSINRCVALPAADQALRKQLNEEKSKREHRRNVNLPTCEPMMDTHVAEPQPEVAIISSIGSSAWSASVKPDGRMSTSRSAGRWRQLQSIAAR